MTLDDQKHNIIQTIADEKQFVMMRFDGLTSHPQQEKIISQTQQERIIAQSESHYNHEELPLLEANSEERSLQELNNRDKCFEYSANKKAEGRNSTCPPPHAERYENFQPLNPQ